MTLRQSHSHQTSNQNVDPEQGYNHAKFKRSHLNSVQERGNIKGFSCEELPPSNMCENQQQWYIHDLHDVINNHTKFQLKRRRTQKF